MTAEEFLARYNPTCFFHFTDTRNIDMIRTHGLLSWAETKRRGLEIPVPGGNDWSHDADARRGLDDFVHLCFCDQHPMEFRAKEEGRIVTARYLRIHPSVLVRPGVLVAADVSNKRGVSAVSFDEAVASLDLEAIYGRMEWKKQEDMARVLVARKYEILVPKAIEVHLIRGF